jgi:hypothetical protein
VCQFWLSYKIGVCKDLKSCYILNSYKFLKPQSSYILALWSHNPYSVWPFKLSVAVLTWTQFNYLHFPLKDNPGIFNKVLLFVTDWQLLLVSAVGGSAVSASVYGLLLYGAYKVSTWKFGHDSVFPGYPWILQSCVLICVGSQSSWESPN